jgi:hypothetical protein
MFGLLKTTADAELAAEAAAAGAAAAAVGSAAQIAAAKVTAADVELALAEAQVKTATTSEAEAAAQVRLAAAHEAVAAAARAGADCRAGARRGPRPRDAAREPPASTAVTALTTGGGPHRSAHRHRDRGRAALHDVQGLPGPGPRSAASSTLRQFARLTKKEMKELRQEVGGLSSKEMKDLEARARAFQITWGDVFHGLAKTASDALDLSPPGSVQGDAESGWISVLKSGANAAAHIYGLWTGTYRTLVRRSAASPTRSGAPSSAR